MSENPTDAIDGNQTQPYMAMSKSRATLFSAPSKTLYQLVDRFAASMLSSQELAEQIILQAKKEDLPDKELRLLIKDALHRRGFSERTIRYCMPSALKDPAKVSAAKAGQSRRSSAAMIAAKPIQAAKSATEQHSSSTPTIDISKEAPAGADIHVRCKQEASALRARMGVLESKLAAVTSPVGQAGALQELEQRNTELEQTVLQLQDAILKSSAIITPASSLIPASGQFLITQNMQAVIFAAIKRLPHAIRVLTQSGEAADIQLLDETGQVIPSVGQKV